MKPSDLVAQVQPGDGSWFRLLATEMPDTGPEAKHFLVKLLREPQWQQCPTQTVGDWAAKFGMTARAVSVALTELVECGYIALESSDSHQRGRPKQGLSLKPRADDLLNGLLPVKQRKGPHSHIYPPTEPRRHDALVNHLFEQDVAKGVPIAVRGKNSQVQVLMARRHPLGFTGRLVLGVLLSFANEYGVVSSLGRSDLSRLTGLNKERVGSQIETLKKYGYIRKAIPGLSVGNILGVQPGMIILNLKHWAFGAFACRGQAVLFKGQIRGEENLRIAETLVKDVSGFRGNRKNGNKTIDGISLIIPTHPQIEDGDYVRVCEWLSLMQSSNAIDFLQAKVDLYASILLTKHPIEIQKHIDFRGKDIFQYDQKLEQKIENMIFKDLFKKEVDMDEVNNTDNNEYSSMYSFARILRCMAYEMAILARHMLSASGCYHKPKDTCLINSPRIKDIASATGKKDKVKFKTCSLSVDVIQNNKGWESGYVRLESRPKCKGDPFIYIYPNLAIDLPSKCNKNIAELEDSIVSMDDLIHCGLLSRTIDTDLYKKKNKGII